MNMNMPPKLALVVPCYNESEIILDTLHVLSALLADLILQGTVKEDSFLVFVDDGSSDDTFLQLKENRTKHCRIIKLTRNRGHQYALLAGLRYAHNKADCTVSLDADLQDDLRVVDRMVAKFNEGFHIVCGVRENRDTDPFFKKHSAAAFYALMEAFGVRLVRDHADFRLLSNRAIGELLKYKEYHLFLRGIFPEINLKLATIGYVQRVRKKGKSKYNLRKMLSLALRGTTSFSTAPIRLISVVGLVIFSVCVILSLNVLIVFLRGDAVPGWASITLPLYFLGGVQMLSLGIIGEYIAKIYEETKRRPHYHIDEIIE